MKHAMKPRRFSRPLAALLLTAATWAALYHWLFISGHRPSQMRGLLLAGPDYYGQMRWLIAPVLVGCWLLMSAAAVTVSRRLKGAPDPAGLTRALAVAYALPLLLLLVLPDLLVFALAGFEGLGRALPFYAAAAPLAQIALATRALRRHTQLSRGRSLAAATIAFITQTIPFAMLVR